MYRNSKQPFSAQFMALWAFALLAMTMLWGASAQAAITPAGTVIKNLATVTYEDSLGNPYTAKSNESVVTVAEVYAPDLQKDQTKDAAPGQTVYFAHQLINGGNVKETFRALNAELSGLNATQFDIYHDINGNGQPDSGEPKITELTVDAGSIANIVVAAVVPVDATAANAYTIEVTAQSSTGSILINTDTINITNGPVLVATKKELSHTPGDTSTAGIGVVDYAITIKNNGTDAKNAEIYDFLPNLLAADIQLGSDSRLVDFDGAKKADPASLPVAISLPDYVYKDKAVFARIPELKAGETVTLKVRATYKYENPGSFSANDTLRNKAYVFYGKSGDLTNSPDKMVVETNEVTTKLPAFHSFDAFGRDSTWKAKTDTVPHANSGDVVIFKAKIHNKGNSADAFKLAIPDVPKGSTDTALFPAGTTFTFWDQTGTLKLNKETPEVAKGGEYIVTIKAQLPDSGKKTGKSEAKLSLISAGDNTKTDELSLILNSVKDSTGSVDLSYKGTGGDADRDPYPSNAIDKTAGSKNFRDVAPDSTATYEFTLYNDSPVSRSFKLNAYTGVTGSKPGYQKGQPLPAGWTVVFADEYGNTISATPTVPAGQSINLQAKLTVAKSATAAKEMPFAVIAEGTKGGNDALKFFATIQREGELTLTPDGANQVEPGGSVFYEHELRNLSNTQITGDITLDGKGLPTGWSYLIYNINQNGNIVGSGVKTMTISGASLATKGAVKRIRVKVMAPSNATPGATQILTLKASYQLDGIDMTATVTDSTTVIKGQIRLYKKVARLAGKGKDEGTIITESKALDKSAFKESSADKVIPGEDYVVWQVIARNEGDSNANNVVISDAEPAFTTYTNGSAYVVDSSKGVVASNSGSDLKFNVGDGADASKGGILKPGDSVEVRFTVKVN